VIRRVNLWPGVKPLVALTFDLCEQGQEVAGYQGRIVDFLRENDIRATFFAGGKWMLSHQDRTQQLTSDPLFEIGNHTWEHRNLRRLQGSSLAREIESAETAYEQIRDDMMSGKQCLSRDGMKPAFQAAPPRLSLFRFPFGACNEQALEAVGAMGLMAIQWDISSGDPTPGLRPEIIARTVVTAAKPGSIILFHANGRGWQTPNALPMIVRGLRDRGFGFATVSDLLARGDPVYSRLCYDVRPGDTDRYDRLADRIEEQYQVARRKALSEPLDPNAVPRPVPAEKSFPSKPLPMEVRKTPSE
jgi:peptidoglycan/xylan/chitin deacetylase (PgdA/CDA1 family)